MNVLLPCGSVLGLNGGGHPSPNGVPPALGRVWFIWVPLPYDIPGYNTGYLSIALPEPAHGWGPKLEVSGWLWRHWWPPLCISLFLAPAPPCTSGQSLRIWHCSGTPSSCAEWKNLPWGHISWARHPADWHLSALQDLGSLLLLGGRC